MIVPKRPPWMRDAACLEHPAQWWFPDRHQPGRRHAKYVCRRCLVQAECLTYAVENGEKYGIWAGYDSHDIRRIRRYQWDHPCRLCDQRLTIAEIVRLVLARVEMSRWCCTACRQEQLRTIGAA